MDRNMFTNKQTPSLTTEVWVSGITVTQIRGMGYILFNLKTMRDG